MLVFSHCVIICYAVVVYIVVFLYFPELTVVMATQSMFEGCHRVLC